MDVPMGGTPPCWSDGDEVEVNPIAFAPSLEVLEVLAAMRRAYDQILEETLIQNGIPPAAVAEFVASPLLEAHKEMLRKSLDEIFYGRSKADRSGGL